MKAYNTLWQKQNDIWISVPDFKATFPQFQRQELPYYNCEYAKTNEAAAQAIP